jgi:hypothetical protein
VRGTLPANYFVFSLEHEKIYLHIVLTNVAFALLDLLLVDTLSVADILRDLRGAQKAYVVDQTVAMDTHGDQGGDNEGGDEETGSEEVAGKITDGCSSHVEMNVSRE